MASSDSSTTRGTGSVIRGEDAHVIGFDVNA
jgi:hypothetical protein